MGWGEVREPRKEQGMGNADQRKPEPSEVSDRPYRLASPEIAELEAGHRAMLEAHLAWCNGWAMDEDTKISLASYWGWDDAPTVLLDAIYAEGERIAVMLVHPYHDEGGPATLTGHLEWDDGQRWEEGEIFEDERGKEVRRGGKNVQAETPRWELRGMTMEFDTIHDLVVSEGQVVRKWEQSVTGGRKVR